MRIATSLCALAGFSIGLAYAESSTIDPAKLKMFAPLSEVVAPKDGVLTEEKIVLGRMLFFDPRLSKSQKISCNSCHELTKYGVDGEPTSRGHKGQRGDRNSPTVYHAAGQFVQFWDGRAKNVEEQAKGPVLNPVEMAMASETAVVAIFKSMPEYVAAFQRAFPQDNDPVTYDHMAIAIGAFERKLVTPSRWDRFLKGDQAALSAGERTGLNAFVSAGCVACHSGAYLGGTMFQKAGMVKPWPNTVDPGRSKVTKSDNDRMMFKVPTLRNIEKTAPYFHDGRTVTLTEAIAKMGEYQLGKTLSSQDVKAIESFLRTLTGEIPAEYIKLPKLPKAIATTPKPSEAD